MVEREGRPQHGTFQMAIVGSFQVGCDWSIWETGNKTLMVLSHHPVGAAVPV